MSGLYVPILYKTHRQWFELPYVDPRLLGPFLALCHAFHERTQKPLLITCVRRTEGENTAVSGKPESGHLMSHTQPVRAVDVRTKPIQDYPGISPEESQWLRDFWYANFRFARYWSAVDEGDHIHIQCPKR
jgi:hypothetical protein